MSKQETYTLGEILVDPRNMDDAMRRIEDGAVTVQDASAPLSFALHRGGVYLIDGHHRVAARVAKYLQAEEEDEQKLFLQKVTGWVTHVKRAKDWPYGLDEEMAVAYWIPLADWLFEER